MSQEIQTTEEDQQLMKTAQEAVKRGNTIEQITGHSVAELKIIKSQVIKDINISEADVVFICMKEKLTGLSLINGEMWAYKDNKGNLLSFAGKDGFLKLAHKNKFFSGIRSCEVRENDEFIPDFPNGKVHHTWNHKEDRGKIIGAWCIAFRKDGEPTVEWAENSRYNKGWNTWKSHPEEMLKKVAEIHAIKKAFGIVGLYHESEFGGDPEKFFKEEKKEPQRSTVEEEPPKNLAEKFNEKKEDLKEKLVTDYLKEIQECKTLEDLAVIMVEVKNDKSLSEAENKVISEVSNEKSKILK